jgi:light-regulated signal transduction histidine kinase (bacteriophytochrome)
MKSSVDIKQFSPLPIVELGNVSEPQDGFVILLSKDCKYYYNKSDKCERHYNSIAEYEHGHRIECPFGFTSIIVKVGDDKFAITGVIPTPRTGSVKQNRAAKRNPECKIDGAKAERSISFLSKLNSESQVIESLVIQHYAKALHETRKYNRTIKQTSERLLTDLTTGPSPDVRTLISALKNINVASELMTRQFDIVQILAQDDLSSQPISNKSKVKGFVHKIIHVMEEIAAGREIKLGSDPYDYNPEVRVSDFSFPLIISTMIENAIKYSMSGSYISVMVKKISEDICRIQVENISSKKVDLSDKIFDRGYRIDESVDGSGNGLYIAKMAADHHGAKIGFDMEAHKSMYKYIFYVEMTVIRKRRK